MIWREILDVLLYAATWGAYNPWENRRLSDERIARWEAFSKKRSQN